MALPSHGREMGRNWVLSKACEGEDCNLQWFSNSTTDACVQVCVNVDSTNSKQ